MALGFINLSCPGCGARIAMETKICEFCDGPILISTFKSVAGMGMPDVNKYVNAYRKALAENPDNLQLNTSIAMCFLRMKMYDKALQAFEKAMPDNFDNSEVFFYAAVCLLQGKKAFLHSRPVIDRVQEYINAALMIEPRGIYYYFLAYIKNDYFSRKYLNTSPTWQESLSQAKAIGLPAMDVDQLYESLGAERPESL